MYNKINDKYQDEIEKAARKMYSDRIAAIEDVSDALFEEWQGELRSLHQWFAVVFKWGKASVNQIILANHAVSDERAEKKMDRYSTLFATTRFISNTTSMQVPLVHCRESLWKQKKTSPAR